MKDRTEYRRLADDLSKDCIVTQALSRFIAQAFEHIDESEIEPLRKALAEARGLMAIHLLKEDGYAVVKIEYRGRWIELIREHCDGPFSHIIEPGGIDSAIERAA